MSVHSPLGASGAERWMNCPGSHTLIKTFALVGEESEFAKEGTAAHEAAAYCLVNNLDAWEVINFEFNGHYVDPEMADPIQEYLDYARARMSGARHYVEHKISDPLHPLFFGTVDFARADGDDLEIVDFKYGIGIPVEVERNPQLMYYAYGFLKDHPAQRVKLTIVQPRAFHGDGAIRSWVCHADEVLDWGRNTLLPAMERAGTDIALDAGQWCRFCPAKLVCPTMKGMFKAALEADPKSAAAMSDEQLGREYVLRDNVKMYLKAIEEETFRRLQAGAAIPDVKLVPKKADRVFKPDAEGVLSTQFGAEIYTAPALKSPAQIEKLGPKAKELVAQLAYVPDTGLTVALAADKRAGVKVKNAAETFAVGLANIAGEA